MLTPGLHKLPRGSVAMVITYMEMTARPAPRTARVPEGYRMAPWGDPSLDDYRALIRRIGTDWLWHGPLTLSDGELARRIHGVDVDIACLFEGDTPVGVAHLRFNGDVCRLVFFGVAPELVGTTAARALMANALERAWARPIGRMELDTCSLDHPAALAFYRRSGFIEYDRAVEVARDPRLSGHLPREACPNIAVLE